MKAPRMIFTTLAVGTLAWWGGACALQDRILFPGAGRGAPAVNEDELRQNRVSRMWFDGDGGARVEAWFVPAAARGPDRRGPTVIYAHGNGEVIDYWLGPLQPYRQLGVSVLLAEYRGYGRSTGAPSQSAITADMERMHDWLARRPEVDPAKILYHGRSLGGGVVAALAARRRPAALVLESTFLNVTSFFTRWGIPPFLCRHPFRTDRVVTTLGRPVLIFHGTHDEIIPVAHGRRLHEACQGSRYVEMPAGHNDFPPDHAAYWREIEAFLRENRLI